MRNLYRKFYNWAISIGFKDPQVDKLFHFLFFSIATLLSYLFWSIDQGYSPEGTLIRVVGFLFLFGFLKELIWDKLISKKVFDWGDIAFNALGISWVTYTCFILDMYVF